MSPRATATLQDLLSLGWMAGWGYVSWQVVTWVNQHWSLAMSPAVFWFFVVLGAMCGWPPTRRMLKGS